MFDTTDRAQAVALDQHRHRIEQISQVQEAFMLFTDRAQGAINVILTAEN